MNQPLEFLAPVREQYEEMPYPVRNPQDERTRLIATVHESLDVLNYYCFGGRQTFRNRFRALVAGAGTGDAVLYLAEQLKDTDAEITYLDMSEASMKIEQQRAQISLIVTKNS